MRPCTVRTALTGQRPEVRSPYYVCDRCRVGALGLRRVLDLGSGVIESANSHVLQHRMKPVGMRWGSPGARTMSALRCAYRTTGGLQRVLATA